MAFRLKCAMRGEARVGAENPVQQATGWIARMRARLQAAFRFTQKIGVHSCTLTTKGVTR
jgi:hypothetical protein